MFSQPLSIIKSIDNKNISSQPLQPIQHNNQPIQQNQPNSNNKKSSEFIYENYVRKGSEINLKDKFKFNTKENCHSAYEQIEITTGNFRNDNHFRRLYEELKKIHNFNDYEELEETINEYLRINIKHQSDKSISDFKLKAKQILKLVNDKYYNFLSYYKTEYFQLDYKYRQEMNKFRKFQSNNNIVNYSNGNQYGSTYCNSNSKQNNHYNDSKKDNNYANYTSNGNSFNSNDKLNSNNNDKIISNEGGNKVNIVDNKEPNNTNTNSIIEKKTSYSKNDVRNANLSKENKDDDAFNYNKKRERLINPLSASEEEDYSKSSKKQKVSTESIIIDLTDD